MMMNGNIKGGGTGIGPCGACKFLRRKCAESCVFAPYFDADQGATHFEAVHKVFGASYASKHLSSLPPDMRLDAVVALCYEASARVRDPVYGCVGHIFSLQQQVVNVQAELACVQARLSTLRRSPPMQPPLLCLSPTHLRSSSNILPLFSPLGHDNLSPHHPQQPIVTDPSIFNMLDND